MSGWDRQLVSAELGHLKAAGWNIPLLGFGEAQLRGWGIDAAAPGTSDPEAIPELPRKPVVRPGNLWHLGQHRLLCGDSTAPESWKRLFGKDQAAMIFTDPPYGVSYEARSGEFEVIAGDDKRRDDLYKMLVGAFKQLVRIAADGAAFYIWHASSTREDFAQAMKAAGLLERQYLIWVKPAIVLGHSDYRWQHEPCFYASKSERTPAFYGDRAQSTVWHVQIAKAKQVATTIGNGLVLLDGQGHQLFIQAAAPKAKKLRQIKFTEGTELFLSGADTEQTTVWQVTRDRDYEHPTQKPVELARRAIENSSQPGEIVADAFLGSGTTLIGAEMTGRRCFGAELDPAYTEVIIRRWERFTGQQATLDGKTLTEITKGSGGNGRPAKRARSSVRTNRPSNGLRPTRLAPAANTPENTPR